MARLIPDTGAPTIRIIEGLLPAGPNGTINVAVTDEGTGKTLVSAILTIAFVGTSAFWSDFGPAGLNHGYRYYLNTAANQPHILIGGRVGNFALADVKYKVALCYIRQAQPQGLIGTTITGDASNGISWFAQRITFGNPEFQTVTGGIAAGDRLAFNSGVPAELIGVPLVVIGIDAANPTFVNVEREDGLSLQQVAVDFTNTYQFVIEG